MSNWRINFGLGPIRYVRAIGGRKSSQAKPAGGRKKAGPLGTVITLLVVGAAIYLCCWGGVAFLSRDL